jgi:hypothetical protein
LWLQERPSVLGTLGDIERENRTSQQVRES